MNIDSYRAQMDLFDKGPVEAMRVWPSMTVDDLVKEMKNSGAFSSGALAKAVDIYEQMVNDDAFIFLTLSGALVPAGLKRVITTLIERKLVHGIVTTGANLVHDVFEAFGARHYKGSLDVSDELLFKNKVDRIYDVFLSEDEFDDKFDRPMVDLFADIAKANQGKVLSIRELLMEIAKRVPDTESILKYCFKHDVKLFAPSLSDSAYGLDMAVYSRNGHIPLVVDAFKDLQDMWDIRAKYKKIGIIVLGGGVPKNYTLQSFYWNNSKINYIVQISLDRPETGGLSGAPPSESVSWGKIESDAQMVSVVSEVTLAFPIIVAALLERLEKK